MRRGGAHQPRPTPALAPVVQHVQRLDLAFRQAAAANSPPRARPAVAKPMMREPLPGGTSVPEAAATNTPVAEDRIAAS